MTGSNCMAMIGYLLVYKRPPYWFQKKSFPPGFHSFLLPFPPQLELKRYTLLETKRVGPRGLCGEPYKVGVKRPEMAGDGCSPDYSSNNTR